MPFSAASSGKNEVALKAQRFAPVQQSLCTSSGSSLLPLTSCWNCYCCHSSILQLSFILRVTQSCCSKYYRSTFKKFELSSWVHTIYICFSGILRRRRNHFLVKRKKIYLWRMCPATEIASHRVDPRGEKKTKNRFSYMCFLSSRRCCCSVSKGEGKVPGTHMKIHLRAEKLPAAVLCLEAGGKRHSTSIGQFSTWKVWVSAHSSFCWCSSSWTVVAFKQPCKDWEGTRWHPSSSTWG